MRKTDQPFTGTHIVANFMDCAYDFAGGLTAATMEHEMSKAATDAGLRPLGGFYYDFDDEGALTGACVLAESHITIHTWPELRYLTIDVFVCNYSRDNSQAAQTIIDHFQLIYKPAEVNSQVITR